jgi:hypothetical protein
VHIKRALLVGEDRGEPLLHVLRPGEMVKTAGLSPASQRFIDALRPDPRYTYSLCNAMGYSEFFGANSNKDWYGYNPHLDFNGLLHAWPEIGKDVEADRMKGKGWPFGYPCFYSAAVYAHHKNTDPQQLGFGDVILSTINPEMKRVELVMRVSNEEAAKKGHTSILDRIRAGERVDVSMGAKVPFDLCSICTDWDQVKAGMRQFDPARHRHQFVAVLEYHKKKPIRGLAVTRLDYCRCMLSDGGKIYPDGQKVFVYNDAPRFFDISFVWIGADRTARVMWHLADPSAPAPSTKSPPAGTLERLLSLLTSRLSHKSASMEKEIPGGIAEAALCDADTAPEVLSVRVVVRGTHNKDSVRRVLSTLSALGIIPTPHEFQGLVLPTLPGGDRVKEALGDSTFDTRISGTDDTFAVSPALVDDDLAYAYAPLMSERSSFAPHLHPRLMRSEKTAGTKRSSLRGGLLDKVAEMYNGYRLSVLENAGDLFPKVSALLSADQIIDADARGGSDLSDLLLGVGPVVQLISSHVDRTDDEGQKISAMASAIHNSFGISDLSDLGVALRRTMELDKAAGLTQAASALVNKANKGHGYV